MGICFHATHPGGGQVIAIAVKGRGAAQLGGTAHASPDISVTDIWNESEFKMGEDK